MEMEKQGLRSGYLLAQKLIFTALEKAFQVKVDSASLNVLQNDKKGDYQTAFGNQIFNRFKGQNAEIAKLQNPVGLMKHMKTVIDELKDPHFDPVEVNDQGFMFLRFSKTYLEEVAKTITQSGLNIENPKKQKLAIDFSSPNVAKEMHVGHLRSTIMGESICRVMEFLGNTVHSAITSWIHRINHIGDWGTQFGMLISHLFDTYPDYLSNQPDLKDLLMCLCLSEIFSKHPQSPINKDLESFYIAAKKRFDADPEFKKRSQETVVKLQSGDAECLKAWTVICNISRGFFSKIYSRLDITNNEFGESFYNPQIPDVIKELETNGHICVWGLCIAQK